MEHWQAHATFDPAGEMLFGIQAGSEQEARDTAVLRVAHFGLPLARLEVAPVAVSRDR